MHANDLKYTLLDKLISIRDLNVLQKISDLIGNVDITITPIKTTDAQKQMLKKSEEDIRQGRLISDDDLNGEEDRWLSE